MRNFLTFLAEIGRYVVAPLFALLPRRHWERFDRLPIRQMAWAAALLNVFAGAALGIVGFLAYANVLADGAVELMLQATGWRRTAVGLVPPGAAGAASAGFLGQYFVVFAFSLTTPAGWAASYLAMTGMVRAAAAYVGEPFGDPLLTAADATIQTIRRRLAVHRAVALRRSLEGEAVPDRVLTGAQLGLSAADLVVIASRQKPDWTPGTFVDTGHVWYRIGDPVQRDTPNGLRTLYPLHEVRDLGVIRRRVLYTLPESRITHP